MLPGGLPRAVIFDCDGTLVDSEPLHDAALALVLAASGVALSDGDRAAVLGRTFRETHAFLSSTYEGLPGYDAFSAAYVEQLSETLETVRVFDDVRSTLLELVHRGVPVAIASSSERWRLDRTLRAAGVDAALSVTVAGDEVQRGKPDPEIFLEAAARLGVQPQLCVAIEDSQVGVDAALAAGMMVLAVRRDGEPPQGCPCVESLSLDMVARVALRRLVR